MSLPSINYWPWVTPPAVLVIALVLNAPAHLATEQVDPNGNVLRAAKGSLWKGSTTAYIDELPHGILDWQVRPWRSLFGEFTVDLTYTVHGGTINGKYTRQWEATRVNLTGQWQANTFNAFLRNYEIDIEGEFDLKMFEVEWLENGELQHLLGTLEWEGGDVIYRLSGTTHTTRLPAIKGIAELEDNTAKLKVSQVENNNPLLSAELDLTDRWVNIEVFNRLLTVADVPWDIEGDINDVAFGISEKIDAISI